MPKGVRPIKSKVEALETLNQSLMEKLGIRVPGRTGGIAAGEGQAEALKQLETRLKAKDQALAEKDQALSALSAKHRHTVTERRN